VIPSTRAAAITIVENMRAPASGWRAMDSTALLPIQPIANVAANIITSQPTITAQMDSEEMLVPIAAKMLPEKNVIFLNLHDKYLAPQFTGGLLPLMFRQNRKPNVKR
jgi:hypothetical protein